jgi:hypothetical protein
LNCRRLKKKTGYRSFFGCLTLLFFGLLCHDVVGALEPVEEEGFDETQRKFT